MNSNSPWLLLWLAILFLRPALMLADSSETEILRSKAILAGDYPDDIRLGAFNDLAWEYYFLNFDSAMHYARNAIALAKRLDDPYWTAVSLEMMAILKDVSGQMEEAINLYLEVIPLRESIGGEGLENTYNNLAVLFRNQENYGKALKYFTLSHDIEQANGNEIGMAGSLVNIASVLVRLADFDSVPNYLHRAVNLSRKLELNTVQSAAYLNFGAYFLERFILDSAQYYYTLGGVLAETINDQGSVATASLGLADINEEYGFNESALKYLEKAELAATKINSLLMLQRVYASRSRIMAALGRYEEAFSCHEKYMSMRDSLTNLDLQRISNELESKYESEKKERRIAELQLVSAQGALREVASRNQRNVMILLSAIILMLAAFWAYRYRAQQKSAVLMAAKNKTIELALKDRETLLKEIHHRVKNNLQVVSSLLSLQGREISDEKALNAVNETRHRVKSMALIHQFLYGEGDLKSIDMKTYVKELSKSLFNAYRVDHDTVELRLNVEDIHLDVDTALPLGIILNELITNALKYAFPDGAEGEIAVSLQVADGALILQVKDNGIGHNGEMNTQESFGHKLLHAFKNKLKATISVSTTAGMEVTYTIRNYKRIWPEPIAS